VRLYDNRLECFSRLDALITCAPGGLIPAAITAMLSITDMSSMPCAASRWPCSTWSIVSSSSRAAPINAPFKALLASDSEKQACRCWQLAHDRACEAELAEIIDGELDAGDCPISTRSVGASRPILSPFPTSPSSWRPCIFMTGSALSSWLVRHENDRSRRRCPHRAAPRRAAAARRQAGLGRALRSSR
jgi:hypothetical protein